MCLQTKATIITCIVWVETGLVTGVLKKKWLKLFRQIYFYDLQAK